MHQQVEKQIGVSLSQIKLKKILKASKSGKALKIFLMLCLPHCSKVIRLKIYFFCCENNMRILKYLENA